MSTHQSSRVARWTQLSSRLESLDDTAISELLAAVEPVHGWGRNRRVELDGWPIFAKSIPLTERERARPGSTANHFGLPCFYNYGVGSAGFGVHREVAAQIETTRWVLSGEIDGFPLLYHHRVLPRSEPSPPVDEVARARYLARWNDDPAIGELTDARRAARYDVVLFLEWIPHCLYDWLPDHTDRATEAFAQLRRTLSFAHARGLLHFDAHAGNIVTDGVGFYLTDFGLALDRSFELGDDERRFFARHQHYDHGELILGLLVPLAVRFRRLAPSEQADFTARYGGGGFDALLARLDDLIADDPFRLGPDYGQLLSDYGAVMQFMGRFFAELSSNPRKDTVFDDATLATLLAEVPARG